MVALFVGLNSAPPVAKWRSMEHLRGRVTADAFPSFLPEEVDKIKDPFARKLASRIERVPVSFSQNCVMTSCVKPLIKSETSPVVLLHGFDSSCLEWRYTHPLLEEAGLETWAVDIFGWGFSDLESLPPVNVTSKREHFYQLWSTYIKRPMLLVGPSLGAAVAIDFAVKYPEAVERLVLIDASVYAEGTGNLSTLPRVLAYAGVSLLKSIPLRLYVNFLAFNSISLNTSIDWMRVGRLHCLLPWWEDTTVNFMMSGGYTVSSLIKQQWEIAVIRRRRRLITKGTHTLTPHVMNTHRQRRVKQKTLVIWGENDQIISNKFAVRLNGELPNSILRRVPDCGHLPHVEKPSIVSHFITEFVREDSTSKKVKLFS